MQIREDITITIMGKDVEEIIKQYLNQKGYEVQSIHFNIGEYYGEKGTKIINSVTCKVKRK